MKIYLVRHGEAVAGGKDAERSLSEKGEKDIQRLAQFLKDCNVEVSYVFHSGLLRAQQTAEKLLAGIKLSGEIEIHAGLEPLDSVDPIASELNQANENILLVGHMPFMGKLAAKLVSGDEFNDVVTFHTGSIVCLQRIGDRDWVIEWMVYPQLVDD